MDWSTTKRDIGADLFRYQSGTGWRAFLKAWRIPGFHYMVWWRLTKHFQARRVPLVSALFRLSLNRLKQRYGIHIPITAQIGPGCRINHWGGIVLNSQTRAGANLTLSHSVTIGHALSGARTGCPVIGNNVFFAPGAVAIGNISIGDGAAIGANATAFHDIPPSGVVIGNPGQLVSTKGAAEYVVRPWFPRTESR